MTFDSGGLSMQGISGGEDIAPDEMGSLNTAEQELAEIIESSSPESAGQMIESTMGKESIASLEGLKYKPDSLVNPELKASIDKVISHIKQKIDTGEGPLKVDPTKDKFAGGIPKESKVNQIDKIDQADKFNVKGSMGSTLV